MSIEFLITTLIVVVTPGPGVVFTLSAAFSRGTRASLIAAFGATLGILPHVIAAITGLAAVMHTSALAFQTVKYLGVAYLLYMAVSTWRDKDAFTVSDSAPVQTPLRVITSGILTNTLNPKLTVFFFAFLPQFVPADSPGATLHLLELSTVFMLVTLIIFSMYGIGASAVRDNVMARPSMLVWMKRTFAVSFVGLSARLALVHK